METQTGFSLCLATLKFDHAITVLKVCDREKVVLPSPEHAQNLGYGIWLLISASIYLTHTEIGKDESGQQTNIPHNGCSICLMILKCGNTMFSHHIKIRADLLSCRRLQA